MITREDFTRINNDVNGNPRYVFHFLHLINKEDEKSVEGKNDFFKGIYKISLLYTIAIKKAKKIGGRKFHNKQYGGGIVIQSYNLDYEIDIINRLTEED